MAWHRTNKHRALQATSQDLDRQRASDALKRNLEKRPGRDELVERVSPVHFISSPSSLFIAVPLVLLGIVDEVLSDMI